MTTVDPDRQTAGPARRAAPVPAAARPRGLGGVRTHLAVSVLIAAVWLAVGPSTGSLRNHVAELVGLESIWLMSSSVLMLTRSASIERSFGGFAAQLWWHRLAGAVGIGLGVIHPALLVPTGGQPSALAGLLNPLTLVAVVLTAWAFLTPTSRVAAWRGPLGWLARRSYDRWRAVHSVLAVFVVVAMAHGVVDSSSLLRSPVLLAVYAGVCAAGLYALVERMIINRTGVRDVPGTVVGVEHFGADTVVITVEPDHPLPYRAGQSVELGVPVTGERPHPFSLTSAPDSPHLQVAVRASGPGTRRLVDQVAVGHPVTLGAVRGLHRPDDAGSRQVWVAAGIGIAPFVGWVRAQGAHHPGQRVDLVWSRRGFDDAPFVDELLARAETSDWLTVHLHDTARSPRLTAADVVAAGGGDVEAITVRACGAPPMIATLERGLRAAGLPPARLGTEAFSYR